MICDLWDPIKYEAVLRWKAKKQKRIPQILIDLRLLRVVLGHTKVTYGVIKQDKT